MPVQRFKTNELTALGAAYLAGLSCGYWTQDELGVDFKKSLCQKKAKKKWIAYIKLEKGGKNLPEL